MILKVIVMDGHLSQTNIVVKNHDEILPDEILQYGSDFCSKGSVSSVVAVPVMFSFSSRLFNNNYDD